MDSKPIFRLKQTTTRLPFVVEFEKKMRFKFIPLHQNKPPRGADERCAKANYWSTLCEQSEFVSEFATLKITFFPSISISVLRRTSFYGATKINALHTARAELGNSQH